MDRKKAKKRYRSAKTGKFVSKEEAERHPDTTVSETRDDAAKYIVEHDKDDPNDTH
ncbi:MAG TPA: hypothetical protein VJL58_10160 [Pyrinomonadaceae bacterium]|nr:hypothetical protein [Pyrinomonadaceae bacterium]